MNLNVKDQFNVHDFLEHDEWEKILDGMDVVIHTAGLAHVKGRPDQDYYHINTEITKKLALECIKAGVKKFVFVSSVAVYGVSSSKKEISLSTPLNPTTPYGRSKTLAEHFLQDLQARGDIEVTIVRPPVVYGPAGPGNVKFLIKAINHNLPMPFAGIQNLRSMIYIDNLCHALMACASSPNSAGHAFLVSDGEDISTEYLIQALAKGLHKSSKLIPFPMSLLKFVLKLVGKEEMLEKIIGSFQIDISDIQQKLGWKPIVTVQEGLIKTAHSFL
jgi:nucleoside-diphosphate-sugar epimerase